MAALQVRSVETGARIRMKRGFALVELVRQTRKGNTSMSEVRNFLNEKI
jgi:hypothetical protein